MCVFIHTDLLLSYVLSLLMVVKTNASEQSLVRVVSGRRRSQDLIIHKLTQWCSPWQANSPLVIVVFGLLVMQG